MFSYVAVLSCCGMFIVFAVNNMNSMKCMLFKQNMNYAFLAIGSLYKMFSSSSSRFGFYDALNIPGH